MMATGLLLYNDSTERLNIDPEIPLGKNNILFTKMNTGETLTSIKCESV